jgi:transposase
MRKIKEVLRLHFEAGLSERQISKISMLGKGTVRRFLKRAEAAGLSWPLPPSLDDAALEKKLFPPPPLPSAGQRPQPDYAAIHKELKGPNVTLQLLWEEYKQEHPDGYSYSRYSELYGEWSRRLDLVLRQDHRAGEKMFVDHAGQTVPVIDRLTEETREAYVFVAVLGASNYTYGGATWTRGLRDWISSHVRAFEFFQGCTRLVVPDNWKSGVKQPCYYEPELNPTYNDLAVHYGVGIFTSAAVSCPR